MEIKTADNETYSFSRDIIERLLYGLVTLALCVAPFLIPGITMRQGGMVFLAEFLFLVLGVIVFSLWISKRNSGARSKSRRRSNH